MVVFVVGTTAELIKIAPVLHACEEHGGRVAIWFTGMHVEEIPELLKRLRLPAPVWLARGSHGHDVARPKDVPGWVFRIGRTAMLHRARLRAELSADGRRPVIVVHGDTFTTVIGAVLGRLLRVDVAHVEAGLRSGSIRSPFPEELNRRIAGRLVDVHFAPTGREATNLSGHRGSIVVTEANTVVDSLKLLDRDNAAGTPMPSSYGVATLHRFELLQDKVAFTAALELLHAASRRVPILFYAGGPERERMTRLGLTHLFDDHLRLLPKASYPDFLPVLGGAAFVVTDSGGLQEECAYLGVPCVVHRERTERHQGLGDNVVLSGLDLDVVRRFLDDPSTYRRPSSLDAHGPSAIIAETLARRGHL